MSLVTTATMRFSVLQAALEDAVSFYDLTFWDGYKNHIIVDSGVQLLDSVTVPHGSLVGFTVLRLRNNYFPTITPLSFGCFVKKGTIGQDPITMPDWQYAEELNYPFEFWDAQNYLFDWYATDNIDLYIRVGYI